MQGKTKTRFGRRTDYVLTHYLNLVYSENKKSYKFYNLHLKNYDFNISSNSLYSKYGYENILNDPPFFSN